MRYFAAFVCVFLFMMFWAEGHGGRLLRWAIESPTRDLSFYNDVAAFSLWFLLCLVCAIMYAAKKLKKS